MDRNALVPVMAVAIVNGIFSPWVLMVFLFYPVWYPAWASALILSTVTIMLAGVPAALYERWSAQPRSVVVSSIWLAGTVLLTLPALPNVMRALGGG
jgi:hypothetical protein